MDPNSFRMFMAASAPSGVVLPAIGDSFEGGFYAGLISHTANGVATHALIVAPDSVLRQWKTTNTSTAGTSSFFDGAANSAAMNNASHPAAQYCEGLSIGGYSDWYLPARDELEIAYYHLKPTTASNRTDYGINDYSVPKRTTNYTAGVPAQTSSAAFKSGGVAAFVDQTHWSSTEHTATTGWLLIFNDGQQRGNGKSFNEYVRAFRKIAL